MNTGRRRLLAITVALAGLGAATTYADVAYEVRIVGIPDETVLEAVRGVSRLVRDQERPGPTAAAVRRRAEADVENIRDALDSFGYYGASISYEVENAPPPDPEGGRRIARVIDPREPGRGATRRADVVPQAPAGAPETSREGAEAAAAQAPDKPVLVTIKVALGQPYRLDRYDITGPNAALSDGSIQVTARDIGVAHGAVAEAAPVAASVPRVLARLADQAFPLAKVVRQEAIVDHDRKTMSVDLRLDTGPHADFGPVTIKGLEDVEERFVRDQLPWKQGEPFDADKVQKGRQSLLGSGLFSSVRIDQDDEVNAEGQLPMTVTVVESKHRSIGGGLRYATVEGFNATVFWEHRNLMHAGERLRFEAFGGQLGFGVTAAFRKPDLFSTKNTLLIDAEARDEDRESFSGQRAGVSVGLQRAFNDDLSGSASLSLEYTNIEEDDGETDQFTLVGLPLGLTWDTSNDLFDPTRGNRLNLTVAPYVSVAGTSSQFLITRATDSFYLPLDPDARFVLANWGRIGAIFGEDREKVPADRRLYGGGGGSVRGYGFEQLGPDDDDGDPIGGLSQLEFGTELRMRITETIGAVAFLEGGAVYQDETPDFGQEILWGAGVGARYYTQFGPIRLDVAVPLNPRPSDDDFQIYISLGQAF